MEHLEKCRQIIPHLPEPGCHQMISLKVINDLKHGTVLPVSFMNEDATNDSAPVGHVFHCNTCRKLPIHSFLHLTSMYWIPTMVAGKLHLLRYEDRELPPDRGERQPRGN